jgi:hypothetical protein
MVCAAGFGAARVTHDADGAESATVRSVAGRKIFNLKLLSPSSA